MGKKRRLLFAILALAIVGGLAWMILDVTHEPVYEEHSLSYWLRHPKLIAGRYDTTNLAIYVVFPAMDSNAVPFLAKAAETRDGRLHRAYVKEWPNLPRWLRNHLPPPVSSFDLRQNAAMALSALGNIAKPAIPTLVRLLKEDENGVIRARVAITLGGIGKDDKTASAALVKALKDKDPFVRDRAAEALKQIDPEAAAKVSTNLDRDKQ